MEKNKNHGFDYYLNDEMIEEYLKKPLELRLTWLYMGNLFRKNYPPDIIEMQDRFREGVNKVNQR